MPTKKATTLSQKEGSFSGGSGCAVVVSSGDEVSGTEGDVGAIGD